MDNIEIDGWREVLKMKEGAYEGRKNSPLTRDAMIQLIRDIQEAKQNIADFILPILDADGTIDIRGWREAHEAIAGVWESTESTRVDVVLPKFVSSQVWKRRRIESQEYWLFRPVFKQYEEEIQGDGEKRLFELNGPQGLGKSVFLHCLALKRAFEDNLVVWVASCPPTTTGIKQALANAFYRGCQAHALRGIPYMKRSDKLEVSLARMRDFANQRSLRLLIIVDQLHGELEYFDDLIATLTIFSTSSKGQGHSVLLSSSTSGAVMPVFGGFCFHLDVFDHFLSQGEIDLLKARYHASSNLELVQGEGWSFLHATRILSDSAGVTLQGIASEFASQLEQQFFEDQTSVSKARKTKYMCVLHMVIANEVSASPISFDTTMVDGDYFFVKRRVDGMYAICEFMQGFANQVLKSMKGGYFYEEYLRFVIESDHFSTLTSGAQKSILEDSISHLLQNKNHSIRFALTKLNGSHQIQSFELKENRWVQTFTDVPTSEEHLKSWNPDREWYVGIPPPGLAGIDFALARTRMVRTTKKLEIFFIQSTVSTPQKHGVIQNQEQNTLREVLRKKAKVQDRHVSLYMTFLTPKLANGDVSPNMAYSEGECYHSSFQELQGNDPLAKAVSVRCKKTWGDPTSKYDGACIHSATVHVDNLKLGNDQP